MKKYDKKKKELAEHFAQVKKEVHATNVAPKKPTMLGRMKKGYGKFLKAQSEPMK